MNQVTRARLIFAIAVLAAIALSISKGDERPAEDVQPKPRPSPNASPAAPPLTIVFLKRFAEPTVITEQTPSAETKIPVPAKYWITVAILPKDESPGEYAVVQVEGAEYSRIRFGDSWRIDPAKVIERGLFPR